MARALRVRLIAIKKEINTEKHQVETHQFDVKQKIGELESQNAELEGNLSSLALQLDRAHAYGLTHAQDKIMTCVKCFVVQGALQNMLTAEPKVAGVKRYKCPRCGEELNSDDQA